MSSLMAPPVSSSYAPELFPLLPELELLPPEPEELLFPPELELLPPEPLEPLLPPEVFPPALTIA